MAFNPALCNFTTADMDNLLNRKGVNCNCGQPAHIHPRPTADEGVSKAIYSINATLNAIVPILARTNARIFNPYRGEIVTASSLKSQRTKFAQKVTCVPQKTVENSLLISCMVTGVYGNGDQVVVAHILPRSSDQAIFDNLALTIEDANSPRNVLFLSKNIELAFDKCRVSFVQQDLLHPKTLIFTINDPKVREEPIFAGSAILMKDFEGQSLQLHGHNPFMRCLSYQAYLAYSYFPRSNQSPPAEYGSPGTPFQSIRSREKELADNFETSFKQEVNEDEGDEEDLEKA